MTENAPIPLPTTVTVTFTGCDRPGVTTQLLDALAPADFEIIDIEQVVIRGQLVLGLSLSIIERSPAEVTSGVAAVASAAEKLDLAVNIGFGASDCDHRRHGRLLVTVIGNPLRPSALGAIAEGVTDLGGNIDRIVRIAAQPVTALELEVSGAEQTTLRARLAQVSAAAGVDLSVQRPGLARRGAKLIVMDVDSTLIRDEVIELIAEHAGCGPAVAEVTAQAMRGEIDFAQSLEHRVRLLAGTPAAALDAVRQQLRLTPGARRLCRTLDRLGFRVALVSGGFHEVLDPLAAELGISDIRANRLEIVDGVLTGRISGQIVDRAGKAQALKELAAQYRVPLARTVAIGDGANDLDMLAMAGLGIAFNAKQIVQEQADTAVNVPFLDSVLYLLGIPFEEIDCDDSPY